MIGVIVFLSILNQMEFHLVQNRKENCHHDDIPFNLKGIGNIVRFLSVEAICLMWDHMIYILVLSQTILKCLYTVYVYCRNKCFSYRRKA